MHLYHRGKRNGIIYVITGGGGARLITFIDEYGGFYHYIVAKNQNEGYVFKVYDLTGSLKDEFSIKQIMR